MSASERNDDDQPADDLDVEAMFAGIVAGWEGDVPSAERTAAELAEQRRAEAQARAEAPTDPAADAGTAKDAAPPRPEPRPEPAPPVFSGRDYELTEDEGGFVPPEPPPLPKGDLIGRLAWAGLLGCPTILVILAMIWRDGIPRNLLLALVAGAAIGFVVLVARLPKDRSDDDDDGAVV